MNHHSKLPDRNETQEILEHYRQLQIADPAQREAILDRWQNGPIAPVNLNSRTSRIRLAAIVAVIATLVAVSTLWEFGTPSTLYGADELPSRLVLVNNFRITGWQNVPHPSGNSLPPTRLPFEIIVQRPGRFRHTFNSISENGNEQTIVTGLQLCDGKFEAMQNDQEKNYLQVPIGPLDAALKTEELAQGIAMSMLLGPAEAQFQPMESEIVEGIQCDLYVASYEKNSRIRLWLDPQTGWPIRVVAENLDAAGTWTPLIEINEVVINGELPDSLFTLSPPEGYVDLMAKFRSAPSSQPATADIATPSNNQVPEISMQSTGSGHCSSESLEYWHGFMLSSDSAVVVWKRTRPKTANDETLDWLSGIELTWQNGRDSRPLKHHWVRPPRDQQWFWSIVKTTDRQPFDRGMIMMTLRSEGCRLSNSIVPLQFPEKTLDQLIQAAEKSLPERSGGEPLTLQGLRALARELR
jgi:outer membrane lipoprotein-sorting protein